MWQRSVTLGVLIVELMLASCASPQSTRLTADDLDDMATDMAQKLAASDAFAGRTAASAPWVITIDKVTNLMYSDVLTPGEQWYVMARMEGSLPLLALRTQKNIRFVIPAERRDAMLADPNLGKRAGLLTDAFASERKPTHQMTATFRSVIRSQASARTDAYQCQFELLDLVAGTPAWSGSFDFKRTAKGQIWD